MKIYLKNKNIDYIEVDNTKELEKVLQTLEKFNNKIYIYHGSSDKAPRIHNTCTNNSYTYI